MKKLSKVDQNETIIKKLTLKDDMFLKISEEMKKSGNGFSYMVNLLLEKGLKNIDYEVVEKENEQLKEDIEWSDIEIKTLNMTLKNIENLIQGNEL